MNAIPKKLTIPLRESISPSLFLNKVRFPRGTGGNGFVTVDEMLSSDSLVVNGYYKRSDPEHLTMLLYRLGDLIEEGVSAGYERLKSAGQRLGQLPTCDLAFRCAAFCEGERHRRQVLFPLEQPIMLPEKPPLILFWGRPGLILVPTTYEWPKHAWIAVQAG